MDENVSLGGASLSDETRAAIEAELQAADMGEPGAGAGELTDDDDLVIFDDESLPEAPDGPLPDAPVEEN